MRRKKSHIALISWIHKKKPASKAVCLYLLCQLFTSIIFSQNTISIQFKNYAGDFLLQTQHAYNNVAGEQFTVRNFRYYVSNIVLKNAINAEVHEDYFLVDESDSLSKQILLQTKMDSVSSIQFLLGVDSLKNVSGVQTGALDPALNMYWTWNTGYVMAKLEGNSPVANTPRHLFSYHVGGYKEDEQTAREIMLSFAAIDCNKANAMLVIKADILKWFDGKNRISIAETPLCHEPGKLAVMLADNYAKMFSVEE